MINCGDCAEALNSYLDRELSDEDIVQVQEHLKECRGCLHLYSFQESVRRLVRVRCQELSAPASLRLRVTEVLAVERGRLAKRKPVQPRPS